MSALLGIATDLQDDAAARAPGLGASVTDVATWATTERWATAGASIGTSTYGGALPHSAVHDFAVRDSAVRDSAVRDEPAPRPVALDPRLGRSSTNGGEAASRAADRRADWRADRSGAPASASDPAPRARDDAAWQRSLTAAAQAWLRSNPFDTSGGAPVGALSETPLDAPLDAAAPAPVTEPTAPVTEATASVTEPTAKPVAPSSVATQPAPPSSATTQPAAPPYSVATQPVATPSSVTSAAARPSGATQLTTAEYRAAAEAFLDTLPGGETATIEWGDPQGHLGGVWIPGSETIILNATRLDGQLDRTQDVLRHEIGHVHQNRAMAAAGMPLPDFEARLDVIFDGEGIERSADAIALLLGASSVRYASTFTDAQYDAAHTILDDRVP